MDELYIEHVLEDLERSLTLVLSTKGYNPEKQFEGCIRVCEIDLVISLVEKPEVDCRKVHVKFQPWLSQRQMQQVSEDETMVSVLYPDGLTIRS